MPSNFLYIDTNFPTFTGEESTKEQVDTMLNYLQIMVEQLRYTLNNLDVTNFNSTSLDNFAADTTEEVKQAIISMNGQVNSLSTRMTNMENEVRGLNALSTRVQNLENWENGTTGANGAAANITELLQWKNGPNGDDGAETDLDALKLWKNGETGTDGAAANLDTLLLWRDGTDNNGAAADIEDLRSKTNTQAADITTLKSSVGTLVSEMTLLNSVIAADEEGNVEVGNTGKTTNLKGNVKINGSPIVPTPDE